jgi:hypothetical protein
VEKRRQEQESRLPRTRLRPRRSTLIPGGPQSNRPVNRPPVLGNFKSQGRWQSWAFKHCDFLRADVVARQHGLVPGVNTWQRQAALALQCANRTNSKGLTLLISSSEGIPLVTCYLRHTCVDWYDFMPLHGWIDVP